MTTTIGFHGGPGGNHNGLGNYYHQLDNAGIPFFIKSSDHYGHCFEAANIARASGVAHSIVFRLTTYGQNDGLQYDVPPYDMTPEDAAIYHWTITKNKLPPEFDKELVWVEPINEIDKNRSDWLGHFAANIGALALSDGYKVTLFGWSSGEPEPEHWKTAGMKRYLTMCAQHPDRLAVSLHEYSYDVDDIKDQFPNKIGRFQQLFAVCDSMGIARPTVHITEWGWTHEEVPEPTEALLDIDWAYRLYAPHPQIKGVAIWYLGQGFGGIANLAQKLIGPVTYFMLHAPNVTPAPQPNPDPEPEPEPPPSDYLHTRIISPANIRRDPSTNNPAITPVAVKAGLELIKVCDVTGQPVSGDNRWVKAVAFISRSYATNSAPGKVKTNRNVNLRVVPTTLGNWPLVLLPVGTEFEHLGNIKDLYNDGQWAAVALYIWKPLTADVVPGIRFGKLLPGTLSVTSPFNSPRDYAGEHEGLDFSAPIGTPVYPGANGVVDGVRTIDPGSGYGKYVRVRHSERYKTWFGHLSRVDVTVGQPVTAGQQIGLSGNSGGSTGPHLHLTLQDIPAGLDNFIVDNVTDPTLYLHPAVSLQPSPPEPSTIDMTPYFAPANGSKGDIAILRNNWGQGEERQQLQQEGDSLYVTKNSQYEKRKLRATTIDLVLDTSPGTGQFYTVQGTWLPRQMAVGQSFTRNEVVRFFKKSDCSPTGAPYGSTSQIKLVARHNTYQPEGGIPVSDVIELAWIIGTRVEERYWYGKHLGLIAWQNAAGRRSWIVERIPLGQQESNVRERGCFSGIGG